MEVSVGFVGNGVDGFSVGFSVGFVGNGVDGFSVTNAVIVVHGTAAAGIVVGFSDFGWWGRPV